MVLRELALTAERAIISSGQLWDGRFVIVRTSGEKKIEVGMLGEHGLRQLLIKSPTLKVGHIPRLVLPTLPAIWGLEGIYQVPHLSYLGENKFVNFLSTFEVNFAPLWPLQPTRFNLRGEESTL